MQRKMNISDLKTLLISARNNINSHLSLDKSKDIRYSPDKYFELVGFTSLFGCCAENGSKTMDIIDDVPSGDALLQQLKKLEFESVEAQFQKLFEKQFFKMFPGAKKGRKYKVVLIIDVHEQETYSKDKRTNNNIKGGKHKNGTNFFFKYMSMQVMYKDKITTLGVKLLSKDTNQAKLVEELINIAKRYVDIKVALLDRGFRDVNILNFLEHKDVPFLMPMVKDKKGEKCFDLLKKSKMKCIKYWFCNKNKEYADVKLLMIKLENGKEIGFYTSLKCTWLHSAKYFINLYKKRWNIETGYRVQNEFLPKTTSINKVVRFFYFCYACAMHNLWLIMRLTKDVGKSFTVLKMKLILVLYWVTTHLPKEWY